MLTEKENYLRCLAGEQPEWVPIVGPKFGSDTPDASCFLEPPLISPHRPFGGKDLWGVEYVSCEAAEMSLMPATHDFIMSLEKLPRWRDIIKAPDLSDVNWWPLIAQQIKDSGINRSQTALTLALHIGYFQQLVSFVGFEDGLIALYEYPNEVYELLQYMSDFYMGVTDKVIDIYQPDLLTMLDDTASESAPFISDEMYREFVLPHHARFAQRGRERGLPMTMHNCGKCESILDMLVDMGINAWDPAQSVNDLSAIKAKYGNRLVITGGWDERGRLLLPLQDAEHPNRISEEELRQSVRDTIDWLAPGGGYCWTAVVLEAINDEDHRQKNLIVSNEAETYGHLYYKTH